MLWYWYRWHSQCVATTYSILMQSCLWQSCITSVDGSHAYGSDHNDRHTATTLVIIIGNVAYSTSGGFSYSIIVAVRVESPGSAAGTVTAAVTDIEICRICRICRYNQEFPSSTASTTRSGGLGLNVASGSLWSLGPGSNSPTCLFALAELHAYLAAPSCIDHAPV